MHVNDDVSAPSPLAGEDARAALQRTGTAVHSLFEFLPSLPDADREDAARHYLAKPAWALDAAAQEKTVASVMAVLKDPEFGRAVRSRFRAEVSLGGLVNHDGKQEVLSAQIDRLVVGDKTVMGHRL